MIIFCSKKNIGLLLLLCLMQINAFSQSDNFEVYNTENSLLISNETKSISIDANNNLWIATRGDGISVKNNDNKKWNNYNIFNSGMRDDYVSVIKIDQYNNKWIGGTYEGIAMYNDTNWTHFNSDNSSLPFNGINDISFANDTVIIATEAGLAFYNTTTNKWTTLFDEDNSLDIKKIKKEKNVLWVLSSFSIMYLKNNQWIKLELPKRIKSSLTDCSFNENGDMFIGTFNTGIHIYTNKQQWQEFKHNKQINNSVISLLLSKNILYIGTNGYGFALYDISSNKFQIYNKENSNIPDNWIYNITKDLDDNIWIATSKGIAKLKKN